MAKVLPLDAALASVNSPTAAAPLEPVINAATPENTPIPGGGRWRWDIALPGWVEVLEDPAPTPALVA